MLHLALIDLLEEMTRRLVPGGKDFAKTHPDPENRIDAVEKYIERKGGRPPDKVRTSRYEAAMRGV